MRYKEKDDMKMNDPLAKAVKREVSSEKTVMP
jgi:hypothetical protein